MLICYAAALKIPFIADGLFSNRRTFTVAARNSVEYEGPCPVCHQAYQFEFYLNCGLLVRESLNIGDALPWGDSPPPIGNWTTTGLAQCPYCLSYLEVTVDFNGLEVTGLRDVRKSQ